MALLTKNQKQREAKHKRIRKFYQELSVDPANTKTAIEQMTMDKFNIKSRTTVWRILKNEPK